MIRRITPRARRGLALVILAALLGSQAGLAQEARAAEPEARAAEPEVFTLFGYEVFYSPTRAMFAGTSNAAGTSVSAWYSSIDHSLVISPSGEITGGWAVLYRRDGVRFGGWFSGGAVTLVDEGPGCTQETHEVSGTLTGVTRSDRPGTGSGSFRATLHHHRAWIFGTCISYSASVNATMELSF